MDGSDESFASEEEMIQTDALDDPFATFTEWDSELDDEAYADL